MVAMIQARRIGHVTFATPDLDRAIAHYTSVLGLVLVAREQRRAFLATHLGQLAVALEEGERAACLRLSFEVAPDSDLDAAARRLAGAGIAAERRSDTAPGLGEVLSLCDPKGTGIDLFAQWSCAGPATDPVAAGVLKFGHLASVVPDPAGMADFYQRVLGFRVADWLEDFFVFLRCNADHHAVNFIRGARPRLHHFAFELRDFAHLQECCDLLGQRRIPIAWGPVRLGPGHNVAIFHRNADDQLIEFYAELDQMKDEALGYYDPRPWHRDRPQRPKVWRREERHIWGPPPTPDFTRAED